MATWQGRLERCIDCERDHHVQNRHHAISLEKTLYVILNPLLRHLTSMKLPKSKSFFNRRVRKMTIEG